ncbi:MAG: hypothetical protein KTR31_22980 [Myxococcales bacterium]|nr:hypothetical protein [Myxococcales bacterium]
MGFTLVEPCSGSAAFALHLLGARRSLLPYQGSKWRFRHSLARRAAQLGFVGTPDAVVLTDPGPWGRTLSVVLDPEGRGALVERLSALAEEDPRGVYERLQGGPVPTDAVTFAAEHLFLQRLSFSGKAVGAGAGRWSSPGFNVSSAYGLAATDRFGAVNPMVPSLIRVLRGYEAQLDARCRVAVRQCCASAPKRAVERPTLVYLDPPYASTTRYPDGKMSAEDVEVLARAWQQAGAAVMVSEQRGLALRAWQREQLYSGRDDTSPFRGKQEEWVTFARARREG